MVYKDAEGNWVGRGEESALRILKRIFPGANFTTQVKLQKILNEFSFPLATLSERQQKESIDIFMTVFKKNKRRDFAIRIQNGINKKGKIRGHTGEGLHQADINQKDLLEEAKIIVVDLNEYECKNLFAEKVNYMSFFEVCDAMRRARVKP